MNKPAGSDYRALALISIAVSEMVAPILLGIWLDSLFASGPWGLVIGSILGVVGGVAHLILLARREERRPPASS